MQKSSSQIHNVWRQFFPVFFVCLLHSGAFSQLYAASIAEASVFVGHKGSFEHGGPNTERIRDEDPLSAGVLDAGGTSDRWGTTSTSAKASAVGRPGNPNFWRLQAAVAAGAIQTDNRFSNGLDNRAEAHSSWQDEVFFSTDSAIPLPPSIKVNFKSTGKMSLEVINDSPASTQVNGRVGLAVVLNSNSFTYEIFEIVRPGENSRVQRGDNIGDDALSASGDFEFHGSFDLPLTPSTVERTNASAIVTYVGAVVSEVQILHFPAVLPPPLPSARLSVIGIADFSDTFLIESLTLVDGTPLDQAGIQYYFGGSLLVPEPSTFLLLGIGVVSLLGYRKAK